ncbi:MAG: squalene synthase HpnC [Melioribacteraceae bacterium]
MLNNRLNLENTYNQALQFTKSHYENFPVVSLFIPHKLRKHIAVVYQFARQADDLADEGEQKSEIRTQNLELYEDAFSKSLEGKFQNDFWFALHNTIQEYNLTPKYFYDLLSAFKQDIFKTRYNSFDEVLNYCERSANPVGRIVLEFFNVRDIESIRYSDAICTALQLTNFYQDVSIDIKKDRIYIPIDEMDRFGVKLNQFELKQNNTNFEQLLKFQVDRTKDYFSIGRNLFPRLPGKLEKQIKVTVLGGEKILEKIEKINFNVLIHRPKLSKVDYMNILLKALIK